uniref:Secreted protein n=1 Tax=Globodera pallida TaxID=36090 RepID=A0A183C490_GLOPA
MRAVLFFAVVCLVLAAILETANSKPNAKKAKKGAVASPSKTKTATKAGPPTTSSKKSAAGNKKAAATTTKKDKKATKPKKVQKEKSKSPLKKNKAQPPIKIQAKMAKKPETAKAAIAKKSHSASNRPIWPISRLSNLSTKASEPKQRMLTLSDPSGDAVAASEPIIVGYSEDAEETSGSDMDFDEEDYGNEKADYNDFEADNDELVEEKPFNDYSGMGLEQNMSKSVMVN